MEVPVLLFEFEGVLAETAALRWDALAEALGSDGIALTPDLLPLVAGRSTEEAVQRIRRAVGAPDDAVATEICRMKAERAFAERAGKGLSLRPGLRKTLDALAGIARLAIVTRASRREVAFVLDLAGLDGLFRPIIALEDTTPPKPDRAPYLAAMAKVGQLFPGQTLRALAIEDSVHGARAAHAVGIPTLLVGDLPAHEAMEADAWIESLSELTPERVRSLTALSAKGPQ
jgi:HAD superfamily hydrolase (TIGR01509 family)